MRYLKFYNFFSQMRQKNLNQFKIQHTRSHPPSPPHTHTQQHTPTHTHARTHVKMPHVFYREIILKKCFLCSLVKWKCKRKDTRLSSYIHTHAYTHTHMHTQHTNNKVSMQFLIPVSSPLHMQTTKNL